MRVWQVSGKYPVYDDNGLVSHTDVTLVSTNTAYATFTEHLQGDHRGKSEAELIELCLEAFFKEEYADKVMLESVGKVDEALAGLKDYQERQEEVNARIFSEIEALKRAQKGKAKAKPVEHHVEIEEG